MSSEVLDLLVIGAGPTGLSAANEAIKLGLKRVVVLEREPGRGDTPRYCGHLGFGLPGFNRLYTGRNYARRLREFTKGFELRYGHAATKLGLGGEVEVSGPQETYNVRAKRVLIATGSFEKTSAQRFMPGGRPFGIFTTAGLQHFVDSHLQLPCSAPVIVGNKIAAGSTILALRHLGAKPVALIETAPRTQISRFLAMGVQPIFGVPIFCDVRISDIQNNRQVEAVTIEHRNISLVLTCDGIILTGDWVPEATLARTSHIGIDPDTKGPAIDRRYRTHDPHFLAAGAVIRPARSIRACALEGRKAIQAIFTDIRDNY